MLYFPPPEHTADPTLVMMNPRRPGRPRKAEGQDQDMAARVRGHNAVIIDLLHAQLVTINDIYFAAMGKAKIWLPG